MENYFAELKRLRAKLHNEGKSGKNMSRRILDSVAGNDSKCLEVVKAQSQTLTDKRLLLVALLAHSVILLKTQVEYCHDILCTKL